MPDGGGGVLFPIDLEHSIFNFIFKLYAAKDHDIPTNVILTIIQPLHLIPILLFLFFFVLPLRAIL